MQPAIFATTLSGNSPIERACPQPLTAGAEGEEALKRQLPCSTDDCTAVAAVNSPNKIAQKGACEDERGVKGGSGQVA